MGLAENRETRFPLVALTALRRLERGETFPSNTMGVVVPWKVTGGLSTLPV